MKNGTEELLAITYVGSSKFRFYRDCSAGADRLRESLSEYDIGLVEFTFDDLRNQVRFPDSNFFYFFTRYGAGAWFWKPLIILDALKKYAPEYLIYVDADCAITGDPRIQISKLPKDEDLAIFRQNSKLSGWISRRASKILFLDSTDLFKADLLTAGILILRNSETTKLFMEKWILAMKDPRVLLHPIIFSGKAVHRHDQSVLSALLYKGEISANLMTNGFYSNGSESLEENISSAWVYSGELESTPVNMNIGKRISLIFDYYSRKFYDILKTVTIFPIHLLFFWIQK